ncbi:MAG: GNAT family N-acetyltransferase [Crocosphaera sp.]
MFKLLERSLTNWEIGKLVEEIKKTPNITGYSPNEWRKFRKVLVAENQEHQMMGICFNDYFHQDWVKLDVLFVLEEFRGLGLGKQLFQQSVKTALSNHKNVYTASRNTSIIKMMKQRNFLMFDTLFKLPEPYKQYEVDFALHHAKWIMNFYRLKERLRKKIIYNCQVPFIYGIKSY